MEVKDHKKQKVSYRTLIRIYKVFGRHYKNHWKLAAVAYLGLILTTLVALLSPWPLKLILDYVILKNSLPEKASFLIQWFGESPEALLKPLVLAYIALRIFDGIFSYVHKVGILTVGEKMVADIREQIFAHLQRLSLSFHKSTRSGDLVYRLTSDLPQLKIILVQVPQQSFYRLIMIVSHIGLMLFLEWRLAVIAFSILPILYYYQYSYGRGVQKATREKKSKESDIASLIKENINAMALVQAYGREDLQQARFTVENRESLNSGITATRLSKRFKRMNDILIAFGTAGVAFYGGKLALEGTILPGTLVLFVSYLKNLYSPITKFANLMINIAKSQVSGERLLELAESNMVLHDAKKAVPAPHFRGEVEFRHVHFAYHKSLEVLRDINFLIKPGEKIALVGASGAGKSTLMSLLLRFYDPLKGEVLIDGRNIKEFTLKSLRDQITVVMQDGKLLNKTVRENIRFGKIDATEEEVIHAAKLAQAHDFIVQMPEGYDTIIYEGGENLSGGQRQRLNIARAIIRNTPILILDEPASALDAKVEAQIQTALEKLTRRKTTFIIAHRLSTIRNTTKILVLQDGQLVGFGTHKELLQTCHHFREIYELQVPPGPEPVSQKMNKTEKDDQLLAVEMAKSLKK